MTRFADIVAATAEEFELPVLALTTDANAYRRRNESAARRVVVHLARRLTHLSHADLADRLGYTDQSSAHWAERRILDEIATDPDVAERVRRLVDRLEDASARPAAYDRIVAVLDDGGAGRTAARAFAGMASALLADEDAAALARLALRLRDGRDA